MRNVVISVFELLAGQAEIQSEMKNSKSRMEQQFEKNLPNVSTKLLDLAKDLILLHIIL